MKISFLQTEKYLFDGTKITTEKNYNLKKSLFIECFFLFLIMCYFLFSEYISGKNIYIIILLWVFFIIFLFLYIKFRKFSYEEYIRNFVEKTRKDEFWKKIFIEIDENHILEYDEQKDFEYKFNLEKAEKIETKEYFYFYFKFWWIFFIPKEILKEEELSELKEIFKK